MTTANGNRYTDENVVVDWPVSNYYHYPLQHIAVYVKGDDEYQDCEPFYRLSGKEAAILCILHVEGKINPQFFC